MRPRLWLALAVVVVLLAVGVAHAAFSGGKTTPQTAKPALTPEQKAARKKLLATAAYLKEHNLSCGCQHHFAAPKDSAPAP
jgi:flagellar basal body-associated protein FliL